MSDCKEVHYISTETIRQATHTDSSGWLELTPWDLCSLALPYSRLGFIFHKPQTRDDEETILAIVNNLKSSLSSTLDHFIPFSGRLAIEKHHEDNTISFYIDCNLAGVEFTHSKMDVTVSDILEPIYVPKFVNSLFPCSNWINYDGISKPLLSIQVTELVDGIFIAPCVNHSVADGTSIGQFISTWTEFARCSYSGSISAVSHIASITKSWFLNDFDCPIRLPSYIHDQLQSIDRSSSKHPSLLERFFNFSAQEIAKLKAKANAEQNTDKISSLQALLGHVWVAVTRARCLRSDEHVCCRMIASIRQRLNPPLPEHYFANLIHPVNSTAKAGELLEKGSAWAAWLLNQSVSAFNDEAIKLWLERWKKNPVVMPQVPPNIFKAGNSPRFNMHGHDFGWGRPIGIRFGSGGNPDGQTAVVQGAVKGSVDVRVCFLPQTLITMSNDTIFMETVTK